MALLVRAAVSTPSLIYSDTRCTVARRVFCLCFRFFSFFSCSFFSFFSFLLSSFSVIRFSFCWLLFVCMYVLFLCVFVFVFSFFFVFLVNFFFPFFVFFVVVHFLCIRVLCRFCRSNTSELMADLIIFVCWFLSIVTIINTAPRVREAAR